MQMGRFLASAVSSARLAGALLYRARLLLPLLLLLHFHHDHLSASSLQDSRSPPLRNFEWPQLVSSAASFVSAKVSRCKRAALEWRLARATSRSGANYGAQGAERLVQTSSRPGRALLLLLVPRRRG